MAGNLVARSIHDLTAGAWFGGSLMGAIGLNGATSAAKEPAERTRLSSLGWKHGRRSRRLPLPRISCPAWPSPGRTRAASATQDGVAGLNVYKTAVTLAGAAVTLYAGILGSKVEKLADEGAEGATEPKPGASDELKAAQKQLKILQWAIPVFAGRVIVLGAKHGEMQRPKNVFQGLAAPFQLVSFHLVVRRRAGPPWLRLSSQACVAKPVWLSLRAVRRSKLRVRGFSVA